MDTTDVTNEKFEKFVKATGYVTVAERAPTKEEFPTAPPENLVAGSIVFTPTPGPVSAEQSFPMVALSQGANWRHPEGPDTATSRAGRNIRSSKSPTPTRSLTPSGPASGCRPKPSGSSPRAAGFGGKTLRLGR